MLGFYFYFNVAIFTTMIYQSFIRFLGNIFNKELFVLVLIGYWYILTYLFTEPFFDKSWIIYITGYRFIEKFSGDRNVLKFYIPGFSLALIVTKRILSRFLMMMRKLVLRSKKIIQDPKNKAIILSEDMRNSKLDNKAKNLNFWISMKSFSISKGFDIENKQISHLNLLEDQQA